ncbi:hypothetical protein Syun_005752 [Stephania yunnanensis]|uniref:Uncharacterized protein n=1 Tax=Stephania yunnanensis TaxID=152371 RepID=A0AAP0KVC4_9MAGN
MENEQTRVPPHVLFFPIWAQGHINPAFQFAKRIASKGVKTTLAVSVHLSKSVQIKPSEVGIETISDGFDETGLTTGAENDDHFFTTFTEASMHSIRQLVRKYEKSNNPFTCIVHDSICPWALDLARELGLVGATVPCMLPSLPPLMVVDMPSTVTDPEEELVAHQLLISQFSNIEKADWLFFNSFDKLESESHSANSRARSIVESGDVRESLAKKILRSYFWCKSSEVLGEIERSSGKSSDLEEKSRDLVETS